VSRCEAHGQAANRGDIGRSTYAIVSEIGLVFAKCLRRRNIRYFALPNFSCGDYAPRHRRRHIMTSSSTLDPDNFPSSEKRTQRSMHTAPALGPSDSSDSGSDLPEPDVTDDDVKGNDNDSDRYGTGERPSAGKEHGLRVAGDIETDRIVGEEEAGLGGGLDEAEEAQLGVTDEELALQRRRRNARARNKPAPR
jgi:hypothetical protein